jgi:flagellar assembly protein FliH
MSQRVIKAAGFNGQLNVWQPVEIPAEELRPADTTGASGELLAPEPANADFYPLTLSQGPAEMFFKVELSEIQASPSTLIREDHDREEVLPELPASSGWSQILLAEAEAALAPERQPGILPARPVLSGIQCWDLQDLASLPVLDAAPKNHQKAVRDAQDQAEMIHQEAVRKAEEIVRQAEAQGGETLLRSEICAADLVRQAEDRAAEITQQAQAAGLTAAKTETTELLQTAMGIVDEVNAWREKQFAHGEMMMLRLVIEIAQSIFGEGLPLDPETLGQAFSRAMTQAKTLGDLRIYVHPVDAAVLGDYWPQRQTALSGQRVELVPSDIIKRGGCFLEGQFGQVDARVDTQFHLVKDTLLSTLAASPSDGLAQTKGYILSDHSPVGIPSDQTLQPAKGVEGASA